MRLWMGNLTLIRFLTGTRAKLSPMKDLSSFQKLAELRNDASAMPEQDEDTAAADDLGLDEEVQPVDSSRSRRRRGQYSKLPLRIVEITVAAETISVLSGYGRRGVFMEATNANLCTLHGMVSTELSALEAAKNSRGAGVGLLRSSPRFAW